MTSQVSVIDCAAKSVGIMPGRTGEFRYCKEDSTAQLLIDMPFDEAKDDQERERVQQHFREYQCAHYF
jgi:hypothetical protein